MSPDDRRPFRGAPFDRGRGDARPNGPGPDRGDRPPLDRPGFVAPRPFVRPPTRGGDIPPADHSVRVRDGDREIEVSGNPAFVRQVLDDLPAILARLRGEAPGRTAISMPAAPAQPVATADTSEAPAQPGQPLTPEPAKASGDSRSAGQGVTEDAVELSVFEVLRTSSRPLAISAIRERLDTHVTGQQVRRLLERAGDRVTVSADRPATYSLR